MKRYISEDGDLIWIKVSDILWMWSQGNKGGIVDSSDKFIDYLNSTEWDDWNVSDISQEEIDSLKVKLL